MKIGALEAGGTKMVCAVGQEDGTILEQISIPTTTPEETMQNMGRIASPGMVGTEKTMIEILESKSSGR